MPIAADHAPFLLLSIRAEDDAADDEYSAMMRFAGLDETGMHRIRLTHEELAKVVTLKDLVDVIEAKRAAPLPQAA